MTNNLLDFKADSFDEVLEHLQNNGLSHSYKPARQGKQWGIIYKENLPKVSEEEMERIKMANSKMNSWERLYKRGIG